jgi:hypothetical protein
MSERQPNQEPEHTKFYVPIEGKEIYLGPDNSTIYTHLYEPHFDHIFLELDPSEDNEARQGYFLWRLKHKDHFDRMVKALLELQANHRQNEFATEQDKETFIRQGLELPQFKEPEPETLTPRQVNLVDFMAYLLLHEQLSADDFKGEGDLYL